MTEIKNNDKSKEIIIECLKSRCIESIIDEDKIIHDFKELGLVFNKELSNFLHEYVALLNMHITIL